MKDAQQWRTQIVFPYLVQMMTLCTFLGVRKLIAQQETEKGERKYGKEAGSVGFVHAHISVVPL